MFGSVVAIPSPSGLMVPRKVPIIHCPVRAATKLFLWASMEYLVKEYISSNGRRVAKMGGRFTEWERLKI